MTREIVHFLVILLVIVIMPFNDVSQMRLRVSIGRPPYCLSRETTEAQRLVT